MQRSALYAVLVMSVYGLCAPAMALEERSETVLGAEGFESPPATLEQMDWLVGQWSGEGIGGAPAMESWLPPTGPTMVGTFVQQTAEGEIQFTEHLYLMEEDGTLVLRLKHFNADLTGWEEKDGMLTFRLVAIEQCAAYFHALTLRCADPEAPGKGLVAAVRMSSGSELLFEFAKMQSHYPSTSICTDDQTVNECAEERFEQSAARRADYLAAALERYSEYPAITSAIRQSEIDFEAYASSECAAVLENWSDGGTAGTAHVVGCQIALNDQRSHVIWGNWLTFMNENDQPLRPEPLPTR